MFDVPAASYDTYEKKILSPRTLLADSPLSAQVEQQDGEEAGGDGGCEVKPFMAKEKLDEEVRRCCCALAHWPCRNSCRLFLSCGSSAI